MGQFVERTPCVREGGSQNHVRVKVLSDTKEEITQMEIFHQKISKYTIIINFGF